MTSREGGYYIDLNRGIYEGKGFSKEDMCEMPDCEKKGRLKGYMLKPSA